MLTMLHPMALAELRASVWFSLMVKVFSFPLLMARSSTVPATEVLINLLWGEGGWRSNECVVEMNQDTYR